MLISLHHFICLSDDNKPAAHGQLMPIFCIVKQDGLFAKRHPPLG